jgi:RluA family pseudouridine synthase
LKNTNRIKYIFEDNDIIILSKSAGLLTLPDRYDKSEICLINILKSRYGDVFTVHRLDRETSGVMVFAKNAESHKNLNEQFQERTVKKLYHAVVAGIVTKDDMEIDIPLMTDPSNKAIVKPSARGKESLTKLKVLERFRIGTLVELELITGRHHQIRVHCKAIGHPLLVDELYGSASEFLVSSIKRKYNIKKNEQEKPIISRVTMHSYSLAFKHPCNSDSIQNGAMISFIAEYPKDFSALVQVLRKYSKLPDYYLKSNNLY